MSNIIPLGARTKRSLPVPLQGHDYNRIKNAFLKQGIDFQPIRELCEQRWLSTNTLINQLIADQALHPVWEKFSAHKQKHIPFVIAQTALILRFHCAKGWIYETTPVVECYVDRQNASLIDTHELTIHTGKPVYIHLSNNAPQTFYPSHRKTPSFRAGI